MPRSPIPPRHGLTAAWIRTLDNDGRPHPWDTMRDFLLARLAADAPIDELLASGEVVDQRGRPITGSEPYRPNVMLWFHRPLAPETVVPRPVEILYRDDRIVVVDKPHFLATMPRGRHIRETVVVRLRESLGLPELSPAHRLDRLTAGVLVLTTERRWRAPYQALFEAGGTHKIYEAVAGFRADLDLPATVRSHIAKTRGVLQAYEVPDAPPNAETLVELMDAEVTARYQLTPRTGKTHQLRLHLCSLGIPIVGDPLYPRVLDVDPDDFSAPLQLVARQLSFVDPVDGTERRYTSNATLAWP